MRQFFQVPVIAVFTKYDQFRRDIKLKLEDQHRDPVLLNDEMEIVFVEHFLANLKGSPLFVRLESENFVNQLSMYYADFCCVGMHKDDQRCTDLLEMTADALSGGTVALILLTIQKDNLELNIKQAVKW
jgi:hypothetical protein